jgi:hypothetical protein
MLLSPHQQQSSNIRPIPFAVLKLQFKKLVDAQGGVLFTKDLLKLIDQYEDSQKVLLLTPEQKKVILPYTLSNPDLEMTADDILQLLKLLFPPSPIASISCPSSDLQVRPRTSPPLTTQWKRRASTAASLSMEERNLITEEIKNSDIYIKEVKQEDHYEEEQQQPQQQQEEQEEQEHKEQEQQQQVNEENE